MSVDPQVAQTFYDGWLDGWNQDDTSRLLDIITDDFTLSSPTTRLTGMTVDSAQKMVEYASYIRRAYPDLVFTQVGAPMYDPGEPRVCYRWDGTATFSGRFDPPGIEGTGKSMEFVGTELFEFRGDRACAMFASYDLLRTMRQVGVLEGSWAQA